MGCFESEVSGELGYKIMIEQYNKIKKLKNFNLKSEPKPFKHTINSNDIKRGYITDTLFKKQMIHKHQLSKFQIQTIL